MYFSGPTIQKTLVLSFFCFLGPLKSIRSSMVPLWIYVVDISGSSSALFKRLRWHMSKKIASSMCHQVCLEFWRKLKVASFPTWNCCVKVKKDKKKKQKKTWVAQPVPKSSGKITLWHLNVVINFMNIAFKHTINAL